MVTPEGLPLAYEVLPGNTADKMTLRGFLERIERQYRKARRVWLMDRCVPTEECSPRCALPTRRVHYLIPPREPRRLNPLPHTEPLLALRSAPGGLVVA